MRLRVRHIVWASLLLAQALLSEGKGKDYYGMLGLKKNASEAAIKKAYRCEPVLMGGKHPERAGAWRCLKALKKGSRETRVWRVLPNRYPHRILLQQYPRDERGQSLACGHRQRGRAFGHVAD